MSFDPTTVPQRLETAEAQLREQQAALYRADGAPVYAPAEMQEREQAAQSALRATLAELREGVQAVVAAAEAEISAVAAADPTTRFSAAELERITLRTPIVTEDTRLLPEAVQVARCQAALASGDPAEMYVYLRVGRALLAERAARLDAEAGPRMLNGRPLPALAPSGPLADVVKALEAGFIDAPRRGRAEARIAAAREAHGHLSATTYLLDTYGRQPRPGRTFSTASAGRELIGEQVRRSF